MVVLRLSTAAGQAMFSLSAGLAAAAEGPHIPAGCLYRLGAAILAFSASAGHAGSFGYRLFFFFALFAGCFLVGDP